MRKSEAVKMLVSEGWSRADAHRALSSIDDQIDHEELEIRRISSQFAGNELRNRQYLQAAQKGVVTRRTRELKEKSKEIANLDSQTQNLKGENKKLTETNQVLTQVNDELKRDNKALKNMIDAIRLRLTIDVESLLKFEDSEIRKALASWFKTLQG